LAENKLTIGETMNLCLLNLICLPGLEDAIVDWLLEQAIVTGFSTAHIDGHGTNPAALNMLEQVAGRQKQVKFSIHTDHDTAKDMIEQLSSKFKGANIHYYIQPIVEVGRI
jgi:urease alpha subunit